MSEYLELNQQDFDDIIKNKLGMEYEEYSNPMSKEFIYKMKTPKDNVSILVYSSLDKFTGKTRSVGEDAIRIVLWNDQDKHPLSKGKRVYRVTSKDSIALRILKAITDCLTMVPNISLTNWDYIRAILKATSKNNPKPEFSDSLLEGLNRMGRLTDNQLAYVIGKESPKGYPTMENRLLKRGWVYSPEFEEVDEPEKEEDLPLDSDIDSILADSTEEVSKVPYTASSVALLDQIAVVTDTPELVLLPTEGYPYKFTHFNPVQTLTFPFKDSDCNLVIGASTSAGKTICAELLMEETLEMGKRVIYLSPLKSLTQEKYDDWKSRFPKEKITILTGDYTLSEEKRAELSQSRIIVMTSEMADSRTRRMETEKNYWLHEVGLVIVDETHILSTSRGHAVESGIMRFTAINKNARILFLSATMPNVDELGAWLISLNGKKTGVIYSTWRPVQLNMNYVEYSVSASRFGGSNYSQTQEEKISLGIEIIKNKPKEKFLVFVHDKATGGRIVKRLKDEGIDAQFHNADLDLDERVETESMFSKRDGGLRVLVSTSTLAWGRNLPARNVVIIGVHRGMQAVDELDIIQMAGRAGRYGIDDAGFVYLIIPEGSTEAWKEIFRNPRPVSSVMTSYQILAFHVLAEIQNRVVRDAPTLLEWYKRSLAYFQGEQFELEDAIGLLTDLEKMEMVINKTTHYVLTGLGQVSGWLYYSPYDVFAWYKNFDRILRKDAVPTIPMDDLSLSWALTDIPTNDWGYVPRDVSEHVQDMKWKLRNRNIQASDAIHIGVAVLKNLEGKELEGVMKASIRSVKYDIRRITQALSLIDNQYGRWDAKNLWKVLPTRIMYGIPEEMMDLVKIPGIGGAKARKMWNVGIQNLRDIIEKTEQMKKVFQPTTVISIQKSARQIIMMEKSDEM